ncbi:unnamed protein product [Alopecurus aequalis]
MMARFAAVTLVLLVVIVTFFSASVAARQLGGDAWEPAWEAVHSGDGVVVQLLRQMYLQRLGAGPSCGTHSANAGCPH